ncbi:hypothetical protein CANDROIZ_150007 [Candidatus Roizmanbacteria bacterium]|nr:hypothetical protein CANDROIZ_150007 [Candidatus Roizmanbacteria bacterium]
MEKKKEPIVFGTVCPHCNTPHQVVGMKCLECHKHIYSKEQIIQIAVVVVVVLGIVTYLLVYTGLWYVALKAVFGG